MKKPFIDMKKQQKRDFDKMINTSDFYKNIQRENQRADYIKSLLQA